MSEMEREKFIINRLYKRFTPQGTAIEANLRLIFNWFYLTGLSLVTRGHVRK